MAQFICPDDKDAQNYCGLDEFYEYTNWDGTLTKTNCGQAAAATLLTHYGKIQCEPKNAAEIMGVLEGHFPPDNFFGKFGTSRRQVERICQRHGIALREIRGEEALKENLNVNKPVIVMLGVSAGKLFNRIDLPGGHWMVAYGFDEENIYLSNWGKKPWDEFSEGWRSVISRLIRMNQRGLVAEV